jgi:hypothetical protein
MDTTSQGYSLLAYLVLLQENFSQDFLGKKCGLLSRKYVDYITPTACYCVEYFN